MIKKTLASAILLALAVLVVFGLVNVFPLHASVSDWLGGLGGAVVAFGAAGCVWWAIKTLVDG